MTEYFKAFDGLRAFAVLGVMALHLGLPFSGGYGVQMFFVLSGFLITHLLVGEFLQKNTIAVVKFYLRRALRLLPALWVMFLVIFPYLLVAPEPFGIASMWGILYGLFYLSNWAQALPEIFPWGWMGFFGHTWTLAVEFQFYIAWPLVILALLKNNFSFGRISFSLFIVSFLLALYRAFAYKFGCCTLAYFINATEFNLEGFLLGSSAAFWAWNNKKRPSSYFALLGLAFILSLEGKFFYAGNIISPFFLGNFTVELITCLIVISLLKVPTKYVCNVLENPVLCYIGKISYGLYLWHFPIYVAIKASFPDPGKLGWIFMLVAPFLCAIFSYEFLERPLQKKWRVKVNS